KQEGEFVVSPPFPPKLKNQNRAVFRSPVSSPSNVRSRSSLPLDTKSRTVAHDSVMDLEKSCREGRDLLRGLKGYQRQSAANVLHGCPRLHPLTLSLKTLEGAPSFATRLVVGF